eukprot:5687059-Karenia_brevis.AAC.1
MTGLVFAMLWSRDAQMELSCKNVRCSFTFHYDSKAAGGVATDFDEMRRKPPIFSVVRFVWIHLMNCSEVQACHVYSHIGHPWNSLADNLRLAVHLNSSAIKWATAMSDTYVRQSLPYYDDKVGAFVIDNKSLTGELCLPASQIAAHIDQSVIGVTKSEDVVASFVTVATANVLSFKKRGVQQV